MKRFIVFLLVVCYYSIDLYAQDIIVTAEGDSLSCKITKQNKEYIYFTYEYEMEVRNTLLPMQQVSFFAKNYFKQPEINNSALLVKPRNKGNFRFLVDMGWGYRTGKMMKSGSASLDNYTKKLRSGFCIKLGSQYYWNKYVGMGLEYSFFNASTNNQDLHVKDKIRIQYVGPTFNVRVPSARNRNALVMYWGLGYLRYKDKGETMITSGDITGNAFGTSFAVSYDIGLSEKTALGIKFAGIAGSMDEVELNYGSYHGKKKLEEKENLSHISLTLGLRFGGSR